MYIQNTFLHNVYTKYCIYSVYIEVIYMYIRRINVYNECIQWMWLGKES